MKIGGGWQPCRDPKGQVGQQWALRYKLRNEKKLLLIENTKSLALGADNYPHGKMSLLADETQQ